MIFYIICQKQILNGVANGAVKGKEAVRSTHSSFLPSSADRGFAPIRYDKVDEAFGDYADIEKIGEELFNV